MSDDLVKFLTDVGPLRKKEIKTPASRSSSEPTGSAARRQKAPPRVLSRLDEEQLEHDSDKEGEESHVPKRESMRLVEDLEGFETERTTNFSHRGYVDDPRDFGVDVLGLYSLLSGRTRTPKNASNEEIARSFYDEAVKDRTLPDGDGGDGDWAERDRARHEELLRNALGHVEVPVIMRDAEDGGFVGAWPDRVPDLERMRISLVPKTSAVLVLEDVSHGTTSSAQAASSDSETRNATGEA